MTKVVHVEEGKTYGPYSEGIASEGPFVFASGKVHPSGSIEEQTTEILKDMEKVLNAANTSLAKAVKVTIYLKNIGDFQKMNGAYENVFKGLTDSPPARSCVEVSELPVKGAIIEMDVIAEI